MGTFQRANRFFLLVIVSLSAVLAACSSGGGKSGSTPSTGDVRPDPFELEIPSSGDPDVAFDTSIVSEPVSITGIDTAAPVSIKDGEYAIGEGEFTRAPGTIRNGQQIRVRVQSSVKAEQTATATLNIGGETATFTVTTGADTIPPEVAILFPPPASMTEGQTLFVRGTVKDVNGTLAEEGVVKVNEVYADLELNEAGDEGTWSVTVDLEPGENTLTVTAADIAKNVNDKESVSSRRVADIAGESFPDNSVPFDVPIGVDIHEVEGRPVALVTDQSALAVVAVDLQTGGRKIFSSNETQEDAPFAQPWSIHVGDNGKIYVFDWLVAEPRIYELDNAGMRTLFIGNSANEKIINQPFGMLLRQTDRGAYLYLADGQTLSRVDVETKDKVVISDSANGIPNFENPLAGAVGIDFDGVLGKFLVITVGTQRLFYVDDQTGERTNIRINERLIASGGVFLPGYEKIVVVETDAGRVSVVDVSTGGVNFVSTPEAGEINSFLEPRGVVLHSSGAYVLGVDRVLKALVAIDAESYQRVIVTKSK